MLAVAASSPPRRRLDSPFYKGAQNYNPPLQDLSGPRGDVPFTCDSALSLDFHTKSYDPSHT
eukprot:9053182-Pyramimonas_sp.AAC.1